METPPFIKSVITPDEAKIGEEVTVQVYAEWPTPNWRHTETKIDVDTDNKKVEVRHLGRRGSGMSIMKIHPFTFTVNLKFPEEGTWDVVVHGRAEHCVKKVTVHP